MSHVRRASSPVRALGIAAYFGWLLALLLLGSAQRTAAEDRPVNYAPVTGSVSTPEPPLTLTPRSKVFTSGLGIGAGLGSDNVSLGGHLVYYVQLPNPILHWAFHVGAGVVPLPEPQVRWGVRVGSFLSIGKRHRFLVGVTGGTMTWQSFSLHYAHLDVQQIFGVGLSLGYELMTDEGLYLRISVGPGLAIS